MSCIHKGRVARPSRRAATLAASAVMGVLVPLMGTSTALANGYTAPAMEPAPAPYYAPAGPVSYGRWDGAYYGFSMGYNFRGTDEVRLDPPPPGVIGTMRVRGMLLGAQVGRNWERGSTVYGIEGRLSLTNTRDSLTNGTASASMRINPVVDLRGRMGWSHGDGLLYAAAGLSAARVRYAAGDTAVPSAIASTYTAIGYTVGLGYERAVTENWSMRGEYNYTQYRGRNLTDGTQTTRATPDFHGLRFGLNRRF